VRQSTVDSPSDSEDDSDSDSSGPGEDLLEDSPIPVTRSGATPEAKDPVYNAVPEGQYKAIEGKLRMTTTRCQTWKINAHIQGQVLLQGKAI